MEEELLQEGTLTITEQANKAFVLTDLEESPGNLDYDLMGLHKVRTFVKGELMNVKYYKGFIEETQTFVDLAVEENNVYTRQMDFIYKRDKNIKWYLRDTTVGLEKNTIKYYSPLEAIMEGKTRRTNIVNDVKFKAWAMLPPADAFRILEVFQLEINLYIEGLLEPLYAALADSTEPFLDTLAPDGVTTIRQALIFYVTI